jgi:hypothetical protein
MIDLNNLINLLPLRMEEGSFCFVMTSELLETFHTEFIYRKRDTTHLKYRRRICLITDSFKLCSNPTPSV